MARRMSNKRAREIDAEAKRTGRPALRAQTEDEAVAATRRERTDTIRPVRPQKTEVDQKLGDAAMMALAGAAGATSLPAAAVVSSLPGAAKLRQDLKERGAEGLLDPANLMLLGSLRAARFGRAYRRPSSFSTMAAARRETSDVAAAVEDVAMGQGRVVPGPKLSPETQYLPPALRRRGIAILSPDAVDVADAIQSQYEAAIGRTSSYRGNLRDHLLSGNGAFLSDRRGGYVAGFPGSDDTFILSHFAPKTLRGGVEFMKELANDPDVNFVMAVPDYQANMAAKAGFRRVGSIPQWFNGEIVTKNVMVNKRTPDDALASWMATHQDAKGGEAGAPDEALEDAMPPDEAVPEPSAAPVPPSQGPRIVINPTVFEDEKDALCVAFNEGFRLIMEDMDYVPEAEPTEGQRRFFSDTAYAEDETQLRRTIVARICTFDTSISKDEGTEATPEQLRDASYFLDSVIEHGYCRNDWEEERVSEIDKAIVRMADQALGREATMSPYEEAPEPEEAEEAEETVPRDAEALGDEAHAAAGAGNTKLTLTGSTKLFLTKPKTPPNKGGGQGNNGGGPENNGGTQGNKDVQPVPKRDPSELVRDKYEVGNSSGAFSVVGDAAAYFAAKARKDTGNEKKRSIDGETVRDPRVKGSYDKWVGDDQPVPNQPVEPTAATGQSTVDVPQETNPAVAGAPAPVPAPAPAPVPDASVDAAAGQGTPSAVEPLPVPAPGGFDEEQSKLLNLA